MWIWLYGVAWHGRQLEHIKTGRVIGIGRNLSVQHQNQAAAPQKGLLIRYGHKRPGKTRKRGRKEIYTNTRGCFQQNALSLNLKRIKTELNLREFIVTVFLCVSDSARFFFFQYFLFYYYYHHISGGVYVCVSYHTLSGQKWL